MKTSLKTLLLLAASFSIGFGMEEAPDSRKNSNTQQIAQGIESVEAGNKIVPINETSLKLILSLQDIGPKGASDLGESLSKLQNLSNFKLNLFNNNIESKGVSDLGEGLSKLQKLTSLNVNLYKNNIGPKGVLALGESLSRLQSLSHLELDLCDNSIDSKGASDLGESLSKLRNLSNLKLSFFGNKIGPKGASDLGESLAKLQKLTNLELDFSNGTDNDHLRNNNPLPQAMISLVSEGRLRKYTISSQLPPQLDQKLKEWIERKKALSFFLEALKQKKGIGDTYRKDILGEIATDFLLPAK